MSENNMNDQIWFAALHGRMFSFVLGMAVIILLTISIQALAQDVTFNWLGSTTGQKSALSGKCDKNELNAAMVCNLRQITFRYKISEEESEKQIKLIPSEFDAELKGRSVKEYIESAMVPCDELPNYKDKISDTDMFRRINYLCKSPTRENLISFAEHSIKNDTKTCVFGEFDIGEFSFEKVNNTRWVSNNGPTGDCGAIVVMTLDQHPEHSALWEYAQTKYYSNVETEFCKGLSKAAEPMGYSWQAPKPLKANCEFIEYGF